MHVPVRYGHGGLGYPIRDAHAKRAGPPGPLLLFSLADAGGRLAPVQQVRARLAQLSKLITIRDCPVIFPRRLPVRQPPAAPPAPWPMSSRILWSIGGTTKSETERHADPSRKLIIEWTAQL